MTVAVLPRRQTYLTRSVTSGAGNEASGFSNEAANLNAFLVETYEGLRASHLWGKAQESMSGFMIRALISADQRDYSSLPSIQAINRAKQFLELLPEWIPEPEIDFDEDGDICFEWYVAPDKIVNACVGSTNTIHFAALTSKGSRYGTEELSDETPYEIVDFIEENLVFANA